MLPEEVRFDRARPVFYAIRAVVGMAERMTRFALLLLLITNNTTNNNNSCSNSNSNSNSNNSGSSSNNNNNHKNKNNMNSNFNTIITALRAGLRTGGISY